MARRTTQRVIHTVRSYRDTWRLFLRFVAQRKGKKVVMIVFADWPPARSLRS